jgi:hypothetical protein
VDPSINPLTVWKQKGGCSIDNNYYVKVMEGRQGVVLQPGGWARHYQFVTEKNRLL